MVARLALVAALGCLPILGWAVASVPRAAPTTEGPGTAPLRTLATLTGPGSLNATDARWNVHGADLGHSFRHRGALYLVFGDTYGPDGTDWRSNVAAVTTDADPSDGLTFDRMLEDRPGHAGELLPRALVPGKEITVIPTYGHSLGERIVLHWMQVREWGQEGRWWLHASGLALSDDDGRTWRLAEVAAWPGDSNFGQVAFVETGGHVYLFGIPGGRYGGVALARVDPGRLLDVGAHTYWDGAGWGADPGAAATVVPAPVGELSVRWHPHYGRWLMMYLNEEREAIVLRAAACLTGPWGAEWVVASGHDYPLLYAPFLLPGPEGDAEAGLEAGPEVRFTMSMWGPYNVSLMETRLADTAPSGQAAECVTPA